VLSSASGSPAGGHSRQVNRQALDLACEGGARATGSCHQTNASVSHTGEGNRQKAGPASSDSSSNWCHLLAGLVALCVMCTQGAIIPSIRVYRTHLGVPESSEHPGTTSRWTAVQPLCSLPPHPSTAPTLKDTAPIHTRAGARPPSSC